MRLPRRLLRALNRPASGGGIVPSDQRGIRVQLSPGLLFESREDMEHYLLTGDDSRGQRTD